MTTAQLTSIMCFVLFLKSGVTLRSIKTSWLKPSWRNLINSSSQSNEFARSLVQPELEPSTGQPPSCLMVLSRGSFAIVSMWASASERVGDWVRISLSISLVACASRRALVAYKARAHILTCVHATLVQVSHLPYDRCLLDAGIGGGPLLD